MIEVILILLLIIYLVLIFTKKETFTNLENNHILKINDESLDKFYAFIYDDIYDIINLNTDISKILLPNLNNNSDVLCVGSKTGHILQLLSKCNKITGLESSRFFIEKAKKKYNDLSIVHGNYNNINLFSNNHFSHILISLFVIHTYDDLNYFFNIYYKWLIHYGYLYITYFDSWHNYSEIINLNPSPYFSMNYDFNIDIKEEPNGIILNEIIKKKEGKIKRKTLWNYNNITLDELIYLGSLKGFKFIKNVKIRNNLNICILKKNN